MTLAQIVKAFNILTENKNKMAVNFHTIDGKEHRVCWASEIFPEIVEFDDDGLIRIERLQTEGEEDYQVIDIFSAESVVSMN